MRRQLASVITLACVLVVTACAANPTSVIGRWGAAPGDDGSYVEIHVGGQMGGYDGCNGFGGRWSELSVGEAQFEDVAMTLMECIGSQQEHRWMATARSAEVQEGELILFDVEGNEVGSFSRAD